MPTPQYTIYHISCCLPPDLPPTSYLPPTSACHQATKQQSQTDPTCKPRERPSKEGHVRRTRKVCVIFFVQQSPLPRIIGLWFEKARSYTLASVSDSGPLSSKPSKVRHMGLSRNLARAWIRSALLGSLRRNCVCACFPVQSRNAHQEKKPSGRPRNTPPTVDLVQRHRQAMHVTIIA